MITDEMAIVFEEAAYEHGTIAGLKAVEPLIVAQAKAKAYAEALEAAAQTFEEYPTLNMGKWTMAAEITRALPNPYLEAKP